MKIQVHRGDKTITLSAKQAEGFAFKAGDRVEVLDHGQVKEVSLNDAANGLRVSFEDGQLLVLEKLLPLLKDHKVSVSLGEQAVLLDGISGRPQTYDMVAIADPSDAQDAPSGPADMRDLPDLINVNDPGLQTPIMEASTRLPEIHKSQQLTPDPEENVGQDPFRDAPLTGSRGHDLGGGTPEGQIKAEQAHMAPQIDNTHPGGQAALAADPFSVAASSDPISAILRGLPASVIEAVTPTGSVPVTPADTNPTPVVTPDQPTNTTTTPDTPPAVVTPPAPNTGGGGSGGGGAPAAPPPPPPLVVTGLDPLTDSGPSNTDAITNVLQPTIQGTGKPGTTIHIMDGATELGQVTVGPDGKWSLPLTADLTEGVHTLTADLQDGTPVNAGKDVVIDTTKPTTTVDGLTTATDTGASNTDRLTNLAAPALTGTSEKGATVTIMEGATVLGTATADATTGVWTFTPATPLTEGLHSITATSTDLAGNVGDPTATATDITVDLTPPAAPAITQLVTDSGAADLKTNVAAPTIKGTALPGDVVQILDGTTVLGTTTADAGGAWTYTVPAALTDGAHNLTAVVTDPAGNKGTSAPLAITVDTTAPIAPVISSMTPDTGVSSTDGITSNTTPTISGTAEANSTVAIFDGATQIGTATANASGNWSFTPAAPLSNGAHAITATATDAATNTGGASTAFNLSIDTAAPAAPVITGLTAATDSGRSSADGITSNTKPTLTGTAEANASVQVFDGATALGTATADGSGNWSFTPAAALGQGAHNLTAKATDTAGNVGAASAAYTVTVDTTAPLAPPLAPPLVSPLPPSSWGLSFASDSGTKGDGKTNVAAPTFTGTAGSAEPNSTVEVFNDGVSMGTTLADGTGAWSFTSPSNLTNAVHVITVTAKDAAGNTSPMSAAFNVDINAAVPNTPVVTGLTAATDTGTFNTDGVTNNTTPTIQGTASPGDSIEVFDGAISLGTVMADATTGAWSLAVPAALTEATHSITAVATNTLGNSSTPSTAFSLVVDLTPPPAPMVGNLTPATDLGTSNQDGITSVTTPTLTGTTDPNGTVQIFDGAALIGTALADGTGAWSFTPGTALAAGPHDLTARAIDLAGNLGGTSNARTITIDTTAPAAPAITGLTAGTDTGSSSSDGITGNARPTLTGTSAANDVINVYDGAVLVGTTTADGSGNWSFTPATALPDGTHNLTAKTVDLAGNTSAASAPVTVVVDTAAPTAGAVPALTAATDTGGSNTDGITNNASPTFAGTSDPNATIQVFDGATLLGTTTADGAGAWTFTPAAPLAAGTHVVRTVATDMAGNVGPSSQPGAIVIDTTAPAGPTIQGLTQATDTGPSNSDGVTANATPTIVGTAEAGSKVSVFDGGVLIGSATADATGAWSVVPASALPDGNHVLTAIATDPAGNASPASPAATITINTASPAAPGILGLTASTDTGASSSDGITANARPTLVGTANPNALVQILDGATQIGTATADGAGIWNFTSPTLASGAHSLTAREVGTNGAIGAASAPLAVTVDTTAPGAATITGLTAATDTGASSTDGTTSVGTPTLTGTADPNATVQIFDGATALGTATADGAGNWSFTTPALGQGKHTITVVSTDVAGNTGAASSPFAVTVDTTAPNAPTVTGLSALTDTGASNTDGFTAVAKPTITGTAEPNTTVEVRDGATVLGTATADGAGRWSFTPAAALADGPHAITAVATDAAGNVGGASAAYTVTVDATAPGAPSITGLTPATDSGAANNDGLTNVATPTLVGTAEANAAVQIYDGGVQIGLTVADGAGNWSFQLPSALSNGTHTITAKAADAAGNVGTTTASFAVIEDNQAPGAATITGLTAATDTGAVGDGVTSNATPTLTGTAENNATVQIFDGGTLIGSTTATAGGTWSFTPAAALAAGPHVITAVAVDAAGNAGAPSGATTIQIGTAAPAAPVIVGLTAATDTGLSATDAVTTQTLPVLTGTAQPGATVKIFDGAGVLGTVTADGTGAWTFTPLVALAAGTHSITATATDAAGNTSPASTALPLKIDLTAPGAPVITGLATGSDLGPSASDNVTNAPRPTLVGTAEANAKISVFDGATQIGTALADGSGNWSFTPSTDLTAASHAFTARATDLAGNLGPSSAAKTVVVATGAPGAPVVTGLLAATDTGVSSTDGFTRIAKPTIQGTATAGASVQVFDGTTLLGTTTADGAGNWSFTPATALADGPHGISAVALDKAGNASAASAVRTIEIDATAPAAPVVVGLTPATDTGVSSTDGVTGNATPTIVGTSEPNATVKVFDGATLLGTVTADATGTWSLTPAVALGEGNHNITASATDAAGNAGGASAARVIAVDTITGPAPVIAGLTAATDSGSSNTDGVTNVSTPTLTGTAEANSTVQVFDGGVLVGSTTADNAGNWSFTTPALAAGSHSFTASFTDLVGHVSASSAAKTVNIIFAAPATPVITGLTAATDTGASSADGITKANKPTLAGTSSANSTIQVFDGATLLGSTTSDGSGNWSFTPATALSDGTHALVAKATGPAGNGSAVSAPLVVTIDTAVPTAPLLAGLKPGDDTGASPSDGATSVTTPTLVGTTEPGLVVAIFDGAAQIGTVTADGGGNWSFTTPVLTAGSHNLTAKATDLAGNTSTAAAFTVKVDFTAPAAPVVTGLTTATDTGASTSDGITSNATPTIQGTAEANATVQIFDGATLIGTTTANAGGNWSFTPTTALINGAHSLTAKATDAAGNTSAASAATSITVDTVAPGAPTITGLTAATDTGAVNNDGRTTLATPDITGTAAANATVQIFDGTTLLGTTTADGAGTWTFTSPTLAAGPHELRAVALDTAGNASVPSALKTITIDAAAPGAPVINGLIAANDTGFSDTDGVTSNANPTLTGTAEPNASLKVFDGATQIGTATADAAGNWTFTHALAAGAHVITVTATDATGNASLVSAAKSITVDTTAPVAPVITGLTAATDTGTSSVDGTTANNTPALTGTAENNATVQIFDGGTLIGSTTADGTGNWTFVPGTALIDGSHVLTAKALDAAGNLGPASAAKTIKVDTAAPVTPTITGLTAATDTGASSTDGITSNTTPTLTGTAEPNSTVLIFDGGVQVASLTATAGGTWSYTPGAALSTGSHTFTAKSSDLAGNASAVSPATVVTIVGAAPAAPVVAGLGAGSDTGPNANDNITNNATPTIVGTSAPGVTIKVFDGATQIGTTTAGADGTWSFTPGTALTNTNHTITARAVDAGGGTSAASAAVVIGVDAAAPLAPVITGLTAATDTGASTTDATTNLSKPTITGTAEANAQVQIFDGATQLGTTAADGAGNWTFVPATALTDGPHALTAKAMDAAGNLGPASAAKTVTVDTVAPGAPTVTGLTAATDTGSSSTDNITSNATPDVTGTADPNATVQVFDGATLLGSTTADAGGAWTFTVPAALAAGVHAITAKAIDVAGNAGAVSASKSVTITTAAPPAPVITGLTAATDTGSSNTDEITSNITPVITGTAQANATIQIFDAGVQIGTATANGTGAWTYTASLAAGSTHNITAKAVDAAGNVSVASAVAPIQVDNTAPVAAVVTGLTAITDTGSSTTDGITHDQAPTIQGTAEPNATIQVFDGATLLGTTTASAGGAWQLPLAVQLSTGNHNITAKATDAAGNVGPASATYVVQIDVTPPAQPNITGLTVASDTGISSTDGITSDTTPTITGTAEANASVQIFNGATAMGTATADASGNWTFTPGTALTVGAHAITAKATDIAGNTSASSAPYNVTIASTVATPTISGLDVTVDTGKSSTDGITHVTMPTLLGTAPAQSVVTVFDGATQIGTTTASATGAWSFTPTSALSATTHNITVKATDASGNTSAASIVKVVQIDTTDPVAPVITGLSAATDTGTAGDSITSQQRPAIVGTSEANATIQVFDSGTQLGTATADAAGAWSFTPTANLSVGPHTITARAIDVAGNDSPLSATKTVTIVDAPAIPVITGLTAATDTGISQTDLNTKNTSPVVVGTSDPGATIKIFDGVTQIGSVTADNNGAWSFTAAGLTVGTHSITAKTQDASGLLGTASGAKSVVIDTSTPTMSSVTSSATNATFAAGAVIPIQVVFSEAVRVDTTGGVPTLTLDTGRSAAYVSGSGGTTLTFNYTVQPGDTSADLNATALVLNAGVISDLAGNNTSLTMPASSLAANKALVVSGAAPATPIVMGLTSATDTGAFDDNITSLTAVTITGVGPASSTVTIKDAGASIGTTTTNAAGFWTFNATLAASATPHTITATIGAATSAAKSITVDTTAPVAAVVTGLAASSDTGTSTTDGITRITTPTINGTAEANATVQIFDNGTLIDTVVATGGAWTTTPVTPLAAGTHNITAKAIDVAGNVGPLSAAKVVTIDTSTPAVPVVTGLTTATDTGTSNTDGLTTNTTPVITGTGPASTTIQIWDGATMLGTTTSSGTGAWSFTSPALAVGVHPITAHSVTTAGGTSAASAVKTFTIQSPTLSPATVLNGVLAADDTGVSATDNIINKTMPTITGTSAPNATITILDGGVSKGTTTADGSGTWSFTFPTALAAGAHTISAKADVPSGATSTSAAQTVTLDTTAPTITSVTSTTANGGYNVGDTVTVTVVFSEAVSVDMANGVPTLLMETGTVDRKAIYTSGTGTTQLIFTYTVEAGDTSADLNYQSTTALALNGGRIMDVAGNNATLTLPALAAANSLAGGKAIVIDTTAPAVPTITGLAAGSDTGSSTTDKITNDITPTFTGTTVPAGTVQIFDDTTLLGSTVATAGGVWTYTPAALTAGVHVITAKALDAGGNTSAPSTALVFTLDTTAPVAPVISGLAAASDTGSSSTDGITSVTTPAITGTTEANASVQVFDGATSIGTTTADAAGKWSLTPAAALTAGTHSITAKATDVAGNLGVASAAKSITIDNVAPLAAVVTGITAATDTGSSNSDSLTNNTKPTLTGTAENNATVQVFDGATLLGTTTASAAGAWTFVPPTALANGTHSITAKAVDAAGNTGPASTAKVITIDGSIVTPVITGLTAATDSGSSTSDGITSNTTPVLTGTAEANSVVTIKDGATTLGTATASAGGAWTFTVPAALANGAHSITATAVDTAGNTSTASTAFNLVVDTAAPAAPVVSGLDAASDLGLSRTDGITGVTKPTIVGTAEANAKVSVFDGVTQIGTATADASGNWSLTPATALTVGAHAITAKATDAAGNLGVASAAYTVTIDNTAPAAAVITGLTAASDTGSSSTDGITSVAAPTLTGTAENNALVQIFDGATLIGSTFADASGNWSFTSPTLTDAAHPLTAKATDLAGNVGAASAAKTVTVDTVAPVAPVITGLTAATDTGTVGDGITSTASPVITGTAEAGTVVKVFDGATLIGTVTAGAGGTWTLPPVALAAGSHALTATSTDTAGNVAAISAVKTIIVDATPPAAPTITGLTQATDSGPSAVDGITSQAMPTVVGTAEAGATVKIFDGASQIGSVTADGAGNWSFTPGTALTDGTHTLTAKAVDTAGGTSPASAAKAIVVDTGTPAVPVISGLTAATDTGASSTDGITSIATPTLQGTAEAGATVKIFDGATLIGSTTATAGGTWTFTPATGLTAGAHSFTAVASDAAGNASAPTAVKTITIDAGAPATPTLTGPSAATDSGASSVDGITSNTKPAFSGTAEANATVQIRDGATVIGTTTADGTGNWTFTPGTALAVGSHAITAVAIDASGNASPASTTRTVVIDTGAPAKPFILGLTAATDTGASSTDGITTNPTPTLTGTAEPGATVEVFDGATSLGTVTAAANGSWTFVPAPLTAGAHTLTATATDLAGNASPASSAYTVTIDTAALPAAVVSGLAAGMDTGLSNTDGTTSLASPTIVGLAKGGATVTVKDGAAVLGTTVADAAGNWSFTPAAPFAAGGHAITATFTDLTGHTSAASAPFTVTVDTSTPASPAFTGLTAATDTGASNTDGVTNNGSPVLAGTAEANATVQVFDGTTLLGTTTADGTGAWTFTPGTALADGTHVIGVVAQDLAGNTSAASAAKTIVVDGAAPAAPTVVGLTPATDTGASNLDGITSNNTPVLIGTAEAGASVKIFDGATLLGTTTADGTGAWSFTPGVLADGSHPITAIATDLAGNASPTSAARTIVVATVVGPAPVISGLTAATDLGASSSDGLTSVSRPTIQGTAAIGAMVNVFDGATLLGTATADASGNWAFTPATALAPGAHTITATFTDVVGHTSAASAGYTVTIDLNPPAIPVITGLAPGSDTGASATDGVTSTATPTIQGTAEANATVQVFDGGTSIGTTTADGAGNWSFTPGTALTDGSHAISVRTVDAAGNASASASPLAVVIQTAAIAAPVVTGLTAATDTGPSPVDGITNVAAPTVAGTGPALATIQVFDGATLLGTTSADAAGNWTFATAGLAVGAHTFSAKAQDASGNLSAASAGVTTIYDPVAPLAPTVTGLAAASDTGANSTDGVTNVAKPTITGTAEINSTVQLFDGATLIGTTTADGAGNWSFTPAAALAAGAHSITAKATDRAGNVGPLSGAFVVTIDLSVPGVPTIAGLTAASDTGVSSTDGITSNATPTLTGTAAPNVGVQVWDGATLLGTATADGAGAWSFTTGPLAAGAHALTARAVTLAGTAGGASGAYQVTIQAGALAAPVVVGLTPTTDTGTSNTDGVTSNATPVIVGTAPASTTVAIFDGATQIGTATASAAGAWSFTSPALADGSHNITAIASDAAGNASAGSAAYAVTIAAAAPGAPTISGLTAASDTGASSSDGLTSDATPTLAGTAAANALVQVFDGASLLGSTQADGAGAWSFTPAAPLATGAHAITATATTGAGANSVASSAFTVTIDVTAPAAPAIAGLTAATDTGPSSTDGITANAQPTFTGTAEANATVKLFDGATVLGTATADAAGAWSFTPAAALAGGSHAIKAVAVDGAGNAGAASSPFALVIGGAAPGVPVVTGLTTATDTGTSNTDGITGVATPTIQGTAQPNASVQVFDGATLIGTTNADGTGAWTLTPAAALVAGSHNITAVAVDGAGAASAASAAHAIVIDTTIPASPAINGLGAGSDTGLSAADNLTSHAQPTLVGTGPADAQIQVSDGATVLGTTLADHAGAWSFTPAAALTEGHHGLTATAISGAGTAGTASPQFDLTIDTQAPTSPALTGLTAATDSGMSMTDAITTVALPTLQGTAEANALVKIYDGATLLGSATADGAGAWTFTPGAALTSGVHSLTATATDAAGNPSASATFRPITIDQAAPAAPVVVGLTPTTDTGSNDHDGITANASPTITGTAEANATVQIFDNGTLLGTTTADGAGGWSLTPGSNLSLTTHQIHATATDAAGNASSASADTPVVVTNNPVHFHLSSVGSSGLWLGDFEHTSVVPQANGGVLSAADVLSLPGGTAPNVPLPPAAGGLVPMDHVPHPQAPGLGAAPEAAPMLLLPDLLRHMG